jgi:hypothetical protein
MPDLTAITTAVRAAPAATHLRRTETHKVPASTATFFVDNGQCETTLRVILDGVFLGEVDAGTKAAFQALAGQHSLCLLGADAPVECGDTGTIRTAYIHNGWSIGLHCDGRARRKLSAPAPR